MREVQFNPLELATAILAVYALIAGSFAALAVAVLLTTCRVGVKFRV